MSKTDESTIIFMPVGGGSGVNGVGVKGLKKQGDCNYSFPLTHVSSVGYSSKQQHLIGQRDNRVHQRVRSRASTI